MKVRVTEVRGGAGDGGARFMCDRVLPEVRKAEGYEGTVHLVDRDSGEGVALTLWRDDAAMSASEELATRLRAEAERDGFETSLIGRFDVTTRDRRGPEPHAARFLTWKGTGDIERFVRDTVMPAYEPADGFCGLVAADDGQRGVGVSLWRDMEALDAMQAEMRRIGEALGEAGFTLDVVRGCRVEVCDLRQPAAA